VLEKKTDPKRSCAGFQDTLCLGVVLMGRSPSTPQSYISAAGRIGVSMVRTVRLS
jgi:hypothetical protein